MCRWATAGFLALMVCAYGGSESEALLIDPEGDNLSPPYDIKSIAAYVELDHIIFRMEAFGNQPNAADHAGLNYYLDLDFDDTTGGKFQELTPGVPQWVGVDATIQSAYDDTPHANISMIDGDNNVISSAPVTITLNGNFTDIIVSRSILSDIDFEFGAELVDPHGAGLPNGVDTDFTLFALPENGPAPPLPGPTDVRTIPAPRDMWQLAGLMLGLVLWRRVLPRQQVLAL